MILGVYVALSMACIIAWVCTLGFNNLGLSLACATTCFLLALLLAINSFSISYEGLVVVDSGLAYFFMALMISSTMIAIVKSLNLAKFGRW